MERPTEDAHANFVVETLECNVVIITEATLPSKHSKTLDGDVEPDEGGRAPPYDGISYKINLTIMFAPCKLLVDVWDVLE